jgi:hypothetical protein
MKCLLLVIAIAGAASGCSYRSETVQRPVPAPTTVVTAPPPPPAVVYVPQ